jgi:hypothetical protein
MQGGSPIPWLCGAGETRARARRLDWTATPLGSRDAWPASLHTAIDIVLSGETPMSLFWGDEYVMVYNDLWAQLLGACHPRAFGQAGARGLARSWSVLEPILMYVRKTRAGLNDRMTIAASDHGAHTTTVEVTYVPIHDGHDQVTGILAILALQPLATRRGTASDTARISRETLRAALSDQEPAELARGSSADLRLKR